ncbi:hypothetical protein HN903_04785 [archaeon]|jgi:hypothetical protein|nr:hypothetical protein [archaeon]MBT7129045.1 hypothetical protein [archaeon]
MVMKSLRFLLLGVLLVFSILFSLNFVVADFNDCWQYSGTLESTCTASNGGGVCNWETSAEDPWCDQSPGCCMDIGCWDYDGTNSTACDANNGAMNCTWDPYFTMWYPNGTQGAPGGCMQDWDGDEMWGGMEDGAWQYNGDKAACGLNNYIWQPNAANENTWCNIKSLTDAQNKNPSATSDDIGCCDQAGCWSYDGNESTCAAVFDGVCYYENSSYSDGWCMSQSCSFADGNETQCNTLKNSLYMPCNWVNDSGQEECDDAYGGGGFGAYNTTDSCFDQGGWYNSTGDCIMPTDGGGMFGGGGFMFGGGAHCWFADNQPNVCGNITGCAYCTADGGINGVDNASSDNICGSGVNAGWCEGHVAGDPLYVNANNSANLVCTDIQIKSACKYGPLPNCAWGNTTVNIGAYCTAGVDSDGRKAEPPVPFCEHPNSKNNYTMCSQLIEEFMMPCTWDNASTIIKNCTFNSNAVFGSGGETDLGGIGSEISCTASGGTWQTEYYLENDILKQDSWCEMTGFFDVDDGGQEANKANCDTSCWACEFQGNGTAWVDNTTAAAACTGSALGYCAWTNDAAGTSAFNGLGWCDYPQEMETAGSGDCNTNCEDCDFMNDAYGACAGSVANAGVGCKWVNESENGNMTADGYCVDKSKKVCDSDCFSCYDTTDCQASSIECSWDTTSNLCSPEGYAGEICFDGIDNDNDQMVDCADPDCGFDNFCGGSAIGGDCFAETTEGGCNQTEAFSGLNCTWLNDTWNSDGWCDMPGANCWKFDNDLATCGATAGCTNESVGMMGAAEMCDLNKTKMDTANCWQYSNESTCGGGSAQCQWKNDTWCAGDGSGTDWCDNNPGAGFCDYKPFTDCMDLNVTTCGAATNCTWQEDQYSDQGGWCNVACMDWTLNESACGDVGGASSGLCEWRDMSATCQPEMFMMMGQTGADGQTGCWQYDGNETGCNVASVTCTYKNDTYSNNNKSATEPSGWCMDKGEYQQFGDSKGGDVHQLAMDSGNAFGQYGPEAELGVSDEVDIMGMGMRVGAEGLNFGAGIFNISDSIICNGRNVGAGMGMNGTISTGTLGAGNSSGKFYWYLDTDGSETGGCNAIGDASYPGYEFRISYIARNDSVTGITETKQLMRCSSGTWTATNALVSTNKQMSCGEISGVMVAVSSQDLESFSEYSKTANMRVYMASANSSDSVTSPSDYVGPGYYTPGSIDFGFIDCSNPSTKDPKCKNVQKFGFNVFEECMNGVDDNEDGLADCADPVCAFTPKCASGASFSFSANATDKVAPTVIYNEVDELSDGAFMKIDTNEPSNMSVKFYLDDSTCKILNATINDVGIETYQNYSNFKPFHALDLIDETTSLGFDLENGTVYYYKVKTCDPSSNCALSACSNFTTKTSQVDKAFIFKLDLPDGYTVDIPALNKTGYNFTETFNISGVPTTFDVGIKTNTSVTKNMNFTVHSNCDDDLSIGFYGVNVYEPVKIDMTNAFICDADTNMMGMNSSLKKWNKLIDEMHLGGASDYIQMNVPITYAAANTFNFVDDVGAGAQDVDDYVNCESGGTGITACQVPVSLGF